MRHVGSILMMGLLLAATASSGFGAEQKIGFVDFKLILEKSKVGQKVNAELKNDFQRMEKDFDAKKKEIEDLKSRLEKEAMVMSREMREEKEIELRVKVKGAQDLERKYRQELLQKEKGAVEDIQKDVVEIVQEIGQKEKFSLILSKVSVIYGDKAVDLTDQVIKALDSRKK